MASCELDYRLPLQSQQSEGMEEGEEGDSSEDEARLSIVEGTEPQGAGPRTLFRSLSVGDGSYSRGPPAAGGRNASDAVESLLLLGQRPVIAGEADLSAGGGSDPGSSSGGLSPPFPRFSGNQVEQRMMVNYYQKMRERNNEASKRCRLKRRIKQDSLDKTRLLLESHREALSHRVAKLHKIKNILNDACRGIGQDDSQQCDCRSACGLIKAANREMPDLLDLSNRALVRKSRRARETNMEEVLGAEAQYCMTDLRPLKRGPRKQEDLATKLLVDQLSPASGALDLSSPASFAAGSPVKREVAVGSPIVEEKKFGIVSKPYMPLAPKAPCSPQLAARNLVVELPAALSPAVGPPGILTTPQVLPVFSQAATQGSISLAPFTGTNTIILTPLGQPGLPCTVFSLPPAVSGTGLSLASQEEPVVIKSEPDLGIMEMEEEEVVRVKQEVVVLERDYRDPTTSCCAASVTEGPCSQVLVDLNSLTQMLDLVTMEPKLAGELTAAEKYIIKSRLRIEFWKAEETPSFICSAHRRAIVQGGGPQVCSVCGKRKSKKFDMYFITYRMAVEFYMTEGKFLSIGRLACSGCKAKGLKGLDFSNSYVVPESGHPLDPLPEERRRGVREEEEDRRGEKREVVLQPAPPAQGNLATIQPLPPRPHTAALPPAPPAPEGGEAPNPALHRLHAALAQCNPTYRAPGFAITSLSECNEGVLQFAISATETAVSTILSAIAPGQEQALWRLVSQSLDSTYGARAEGELGTSSLHLPAEKMDDI